MAELRPARRAAGNPADPIGLMGHVIADYPDAAAVRRMVGIMAGEGVEVVEVQIPFSEPMADGPVFLAANHAALAGGVNLRRSLDLVRELSERHPAVSFVFMSYLNVLYRQGYPAIAAAMAAAGAKGVIVPDLPFDRAQPLETELARHRLQNIRLVAPNCPEERLPRLLAGAGGLVYAVARAGVTGARSEFGAEIRAFVGRLRPLTGAAIAVGFGVRAPDDIRALRGSADLAVVGTASLEAWRSGGESDFSSLWKGLSAAAR